MIDPLVSLLLPQEEQATQNDISSHIRIEEAIDCRDSNSRFFSLLNRESSLNIIISEQSTVMSCKLGTQEIVVGRHLYNETHETWAVGDRPFQKLSNLAWNSHVRGSELILSSSSPMNNAINSNANNGSTTSNQNPHTSLHFELTRTNELNCVGKLKTIHLQHQVFYFNLNQDIQRKTSIDGHTLAVRCNGSMSRVQSQPTRLLCPCNKLINSTSPLAKSFISDIPRELTHSELRVDHSNETNNHPTNPDDVIVCDSIYSLESTSALDYLQAQLQFRNCSLVFEVRSAKSLNNSSGGSSVSSSSTAPSSSNSTPGQQKDRSQSVSGTVTTNFRHSSRTYDLKKFIDPTNIQEETELENSQAQGSSIQIKQEPGELQQESHRPAAVNNDDSIASSSSQSGSTAPTSAIKQEIVGNDSAGPTSSTQQSVALQAVPTPSPSSIASSTNPHSNEAKQHIIGTTSGAGGQGKISALSSTSHPSTILRLRVRITNFGVSILPHMMTNYTCSYRFYW